MKAYVFYNDENRRALMVMDKDGFVFEESIQDWTYYVDIMRGSAYWLHTDGRTYADWTVS